LKSSPPFGTAAASGRRPNLEGRERILPYIGEPTQRANSRLYDATDNQFQRRVIALAKREGVMRRRYHGTHAICCEKNRVSEQLD
jgi:hypothetical protein